MVRPLLPGKQPRTTKSSSSAMVVLVVLIAVFGLGFVMGQVFSQSNCPSVPQIDPCPLSLHDSNKRNDGWHSIEVFYGKTDHLERMLPHDQQWFSQARQDEAIASLLHQKRNGYFVDLAANDATILSNTYSLERNLQWSGLCIEPNPLYWANLTYRDCQVVAAIVGSQRMEEVFFRFNAGDHSGIAGEGFDNGKHLQRQSEPKYTVTLHEILKRFQAPQKIDYLSLDVEGAEEFILKNFPLNDYQISLMTVERPKDSLRALLQAHGFQFVKRLSRWGETLWAHESVYPSLDLTHLEEFTPTKKPKEEEGGPADAR